MNIIDYCKWRGDIAFSYDPFNEVDNLCIAQMTYTHLSGVIPKDGSITVAEAAKAYFEKHTEKEVLDSKSFVGLAPMVLKAMGESKRFGSCRIYNYVSLRHEAESEQFCALMMDLGDGTTVVSFRGTDDTLIGWREDLMLSIKVVEAQKDAVNYVNSYCKGFKKYRFIGHSKGGNLAVYAAVHCDRSIDRKIVSVISNDGPGMRPGTYTDEDFARLKDRYLKIMPEHDVFGKIYDSDYSKMIIRSSANGMLQHDAMSWQVERNAFVKADRLSRDSILIGNGINVFLSETTHEQRRIFIEGLFDSLDEAGIDNITDFAEGGLPVVLKALRKLSTVDETTKEMALKLVKSLASVYGDDLSDAFLTGKEYVINFKNELGERIESRVNDSKVLLDRFSRFGRKTTKEE